MSESIVIFRVILDAAVLPDVSGIGDVRGIGDVFVFWMITLSVGIILGTAAIIFFVSRSRKNKKK